MKSIPQLRAKLTIWIPFLIIIVTSIIYARKKSMGVIEGQTMGTTYTVKFVYTGSGPDLNIIQKAIDEKLQDINRQMSTYIEDSEISRFNRLPVTHEWMNISKEFYEVLLLSKEVYEKSEGYFDPTLGPAINAWGFGEDGTWNVIPSEAKLKNISESVGFEKIEISPTKWAIRKHAQDVKINLSAVAKGYAVDKVSEFLSSIGTRDYMVEIGGEIRVSGTKTEGLPWKIALEKPLPTGSEIQKIISLSDMATASSGDYRNYFEKDGVRYSHIISSTTLKPVTHKLASVTVFNKSCATADAWATAILAAGPEKGQYLAEKWNLSVYFIEKNTGTTFHTKTSKLFDEQIDFVKL